MGPYESLDQNQGIRSRGRSWQFSGETSASANPVGLRGLHLPILLRNEIIGQREAWHCRYAPPPSVHVGPTRNIHTAFRHEYHAAEAADVRDRARLSHQPLPFGKRALHEVERLLGERTEML